MPIAPPASPSVAARSQIGDPALRARFDALYADYAAALDDQRLDDWLAFFAEDCHYRLQPRENHDRGLPLATMAFESLGMLRDRVYAVTETLFHAPYRQRHLFGPLRLIGIEAESVQIELNYAVYRTRVQQPTEVFNVGRSIDTWQCRDGRWLIASKHVVFDSDLIANSIIYPI
jgi:salicylate 5-hydroxylase small subunit